MRESVFFEARLRRFGVWRGAVFAIGTAAIAVAVAWAIAMSASASEGGATLVGAAAALLCAATMAAVWSLARVEAGVLSCRDGIWTFAPDVGAPRAGALEVALDLGGFLLLRLDPERAGPWLPVQRRGLEAHWHALRCAVFAPSVRVDAPSDFQSASRPPSPHE